MNHLTDVQKAKYEYTATGLFVTGAVLFVIGSILLFIVSKQDLQETYHKENNQLFL